MIRFALLLCLLPCAGLADIRFADQSAQLGGHSYTGGWEHFVGGGVAVFDCNDDSMPEIFAAGGTSPAALWRNEGGFQFSPLAIPEITGATGAYPLDLDGDGLLDLFVLRVGPNITLKGGPECTFSVADIGLPPDNAWSTAFTAWYDAGQTRPTLAVGNYVDRTNPNGPFEACDDNTLLRPAATGWDAQPLSPGFCALSLLAAQDARGRPTLRLSNDRHYYVRGGSDQMWDIEDERFLTQADGWDAPQLWGMGIASRDLTGDGRDEVLLTSMGDQLLQIAQENGRYAPAPFSIGTYAQRPHLGSDGRPSTGWHAQFGDLDNNGLPDLFIAKGNVDQMPSNAMEDPNNLLMQQPDGTFIEASIAAGVASTQRSRGVALVDFDLDGRLDLVVVNRRAGMELYRNITENTGNWVTIDLAQSGPNPKAIGARVFVDGDNGQSQNQQRSIGGGHAGGQFGPLHFGIGSALGITIRVVWPDGAEQGPLTVPANTRTTIQRIR